MCMPKGVMRQYGSKTGSQNGSQKCFAKDSEKGSRQVTVLQRVLEGGKVWGRSGPISPHLMATGQDQKSHPKASF